MARFFRLAALVTAAGGLVCGVFLLAAMWWEQMHTVSPSAANESAFLKNYSPEAVVHSFQAKGFTSTLSGGSSGGSGSEFATHTTDFDAKFTMRSAEESRLMSSVRDDVECQLKASGAQILKQGGDAVEGFRFAYRSGSSLGSVVIGPLRPANMRRATPLGDGLEDVSVTISAEEKWFARTAAGEKLVSRVR
jgi:hypothetical protein